MLLALALGVVHFPSPSRKVVADGVPVALMPPTGSPVALVRVAEEGVPRGPPAYTRVTDAGTVVLLTVGTVRLPVSVGEAERTTLPVPVVA
jgi:hypothetical protein